jgi:hypothetical protein
MVATSNALKIADEIEELSFDFRPFVDAHGVVPEPSSARIKNFQKTLRKLFGPAFQAIADAEGKTQQELIKSAMEASDEEVDAKADETEESLLRACAALCGDSPSYDQLVQLPYRGQRVFLGWLVGKFLNPESQAPATNQ